MDHEVFSMPELGESISSAAGFDQRLRYPLVHGYRLGEEIGGGGFSKYVPCS
jgi:hypothetical protein